MLAAFVSIDSERAGGLLSATTLRGFSTDNPAVSGRRRPMSNQLFFIIGPIEIEKAGPSHKPSLFFTALGAVFIGRRRSASTPMCPHPTAATP